jgi:hypothetical protein
MATISRCRSAVQVGSLLGDLSKTLGALLLDFSESLDALLREVRESAFELCTSRCQGCIAASPELSLQLAQQYIEHNGFLW